MSKFNGHFFSIVLLGRQNPQILNHNFLLNNKVLPKHEEPFKELLSKQGSRPFSEFISTPVLASIQYGPVSLVVEENRYQIVDTRFARLKESPIVEITKRYFGKLLRYTPFTAGGLNFNGAVQFSDSEDEKAFDKQLGAGRDAIIQMVGTADVRIGVTFNYSWKNGVIEIQLPKPKDRAKPGTINFNYEFGYRDIDSFLANLDDLDEIHKKFHNFLRQLGVREAT